MWLIWVIVIVVVVLAIGAIVSMTRSKRTEQNRTHAEELRTEATTQAGGLSESQREAEEARAQAELAKAEADRAAERADAAEQGHQVEQASYEDKLREADQVDPDVNTRAADYEPSVWNDESTDSTATTSDAATPGTTGSHRATEVEEPITSDDTTVTETTDEAPGESRRTTE
jgi:outer membrane murein-binding lipoprotein Lpp